MSLEELIDEVHFELASIGFDSELYLDQRLQLNILDGKGYADLFTYLGIYNDSTLRANAVKIELWFEELNTWFTLGSMEINATVWCPGTNRSFIQLTNT